MLAPKRRQFKRYDINLATTMAVEGFGLIQCMIRDFGAGGVFITLQQNKGIEALSIQQQILVHFSVNLDHIDEDFSLEVKIVHIDSNGFGVAFAGNSEFFFKALAKEVQSNLNLPISDKPALPNGLSKQERMEADFISLSREEFPIIIDSFFKYAEKKIQQATEDAKNYHTHVTLLDTFTNLKISKNSLFKNFCKFGHQLTLTETSFTTDQFTKAPEKSQLSLVEKNDYEDWLNLLPTIRNLETLFSSRLSSIQEKMAFILERDKNEVINPLSPIVLCKKFRDALSEIEDNGPGKNWLYTLYGEVLTKQLPHIYKKIDAILLGYRVQRKKGDYTAKGDVDLTTRQKDDDSSQSNTPLPSAAKNNKPQTNQAVNFAQETLRKIKEQDSPSQPSANSDTVLPPASPIAPAKESKKVLNFASNLMNLVQGKNIFQQGNKSEDGFDEYSAEEICSALSLLQQNIVEGKSQPQVDFHSLHNELQQALNSFTTVQKRLSITDKNNLDVYNSLIKTLFNDSLLTQKTQAYLQKMYIPIMTQAIQNPSLLESGNHPVRDIINHLSRLERVVNDNKIIKNTHVRELIDQQLKKISNESIKDPAIFSLVERNLNKLAQSVEKSIELNLKRVRDIYEGKQKLKDAQQYVQNDINQNLGGKKIPKVVVTLLKTGWQHLLVIAKLNSDKQSYKTYLLTINNLIAWLTGSKQLSEKLAITALEYIDKELLPVSANRLVHSTIQNELSDLLLGKTMRLGSDALEMAVIKVNKKQTDSVSIKKGNSEVDYLQEGEWLSFFLEEDLGPLKLAWINNTHDQFVFVNREGIKKLEVNAENLAGMIRIGTASWVESLDTHIMERATSMMLQKLHGKLIYNATHDSTTCLLNQKEFISQLKRELSKLGNAKYLLCNIEIQDFRTITNACGLSGVEALLKQLAKLLKQHANKEDIYARINDRTFSVLLKNCSAKDAKKLHTQFINSEFKWHDKNYAVAASMGILPLFSENYNEINSILQNVDSANLSALSAGRNCIRVYKDDDESLQSQFNAREWVGRINQVLAENRLFLRCQKITAINPETSALDHYEILLGIKGENGKIIAPNDFIPAVERCQRMSEVDRWVVLSVLDWIRNNQKAFEMLNGFSINLSGESMNSEAFLRFLKRTLSSSGIPLEKITFEITETVAADNFQFIQTFIKQIKRFKCKFSLDDFGSGYSTFSYLKSLAVDSLKIDGIFVKDIVNNSTDIAIVSSMNEIAHFLKLETTAEYVENDEVHELLKKIGVDYAQGWGVEKPKLLTDLGMGMK